MRGSLPCQGETTGPMTHQLMADPATNWVESTLIRRGFANLGSPSGAVRRR
jgi:hypothetical protein